MESQLAQYLQEVDRLFVPAARTRVHEPDAADPVEHAHRRLLAYMLYD